MVPGRALPVLLTFILSPILLAADTHYVDVDCATPGPPYTNWATAATVIQDAVDAAEDGDSVLVADGRYATGGRTAEGYELMNRVAIMKGVTVRSVNGPAVTTIAGRAADYVFGVPVAPGVRCVHVSGGGVLDGFTLTGGDATPLPTNRHARDFCGGGSWTLGGTVRNCVISGNNATRQGGGTYEGTFINCRIVSNHVLGGGGGASDGVMRNCLISGNSSLAYGGGVAGGTMVNCTITGNSTDGAGGGGYEGVYVNSIVYHNSAVNGQPNIDTNTVAYCVSTCATPVPEGEGNIASAPEFMDAPSGDYRLPSSSPCIDAGQNLGWMKGAVDLNGGKRIFGVSVDMGAFEYAMTTDVKVAIQGAYTNGGDRIMSAALSAAGSLPTTSPYAADPVGVLSIPSNATDWVLLQLMDINSGEVVASRSGLLTVEGWVIDERLSRGVCLETSPGYYRLAVKHRNHVALTSATDVAFTNRLIAYDFTTGPDMAEGGTNVCVELAAGIWGMTAGDCDGDGQVTQVDRAIVSNQVGKTGYLVGDLNLDGVVTEED